MTELVLILAIVCCSTLGAAIITRSVLGADAGGPERRRLGAALARASTSFLLRVSLAVGTVMAPIVCAFAALGALRGASGWVSLLAGSLFGAAFALAMAWLAVRLTLAASLRAAPTTATSLDATLSIAIRSGALSGIAVEGGSLLAVAAFVVPAVRDSDASLTASVAAGPIGLALGAAACAAVVHLTGSRYRAAAQVGADLGGQVEADLAADDPKNPAAVAALVGHHVGTAASHTADMVVTSTAASAAAILVGLSVASTTTPFLAAAFLPLVIRAFGAMACGFGVAVVRAHENAGADGALLRGRLVANVISLAGLAGASIWLFGEARWGPFFAAGVLGITASFLASYLRLAPTTRAQKGMKDLLESARTGAGPLVAHALGCGLERAALPAGLVGVALGGSFLLVEASAPGAGVLGVATAVSAMLAESAYLLAVSAFGVVATSSRAVDALAFVAAEDAGTRIAIRLEDSAAVSGARLETALPILGTAAVIAALAPGMLGFGESGGALAIGGAALGAAVAAASAGAQIRSAARGASAIAREVERQLRGFPREQGLSVVPRDHTPSYRACVDVAAREALSRAPWSVLAAAFAPFALGLALASAHAPNLARPMLTGFAIGAALWGVLWSLSSTSAAASLSAAHRAVRGASSVPIRTAALHGAAVGSFVGAAGAPAAHLCARTCAVVAIACIPLFG